MFANPAASRYHSQHNANSACEHCGGVVRAMSAGASLAIQRCNTPTKSCWIPRRWRWSIG